MGSGAGPNRGGGRRTGGGGHQAGQGEMAAVKLKNAKLRAEKDARAPLATPSVRFRRRRARRRRARRRGGGGRGGGDTHEVVATTALNQELVQGLLLARGPADARATADPTRCPHPGRIEGPRVSPRAAPAVDVDIRVDVDLEDVERKTWAQLEKKGFGANASPPR